jgi:hypothetical protein
VAEALVAHPFRVDFLQKRENVQIYLCQHPEIIGGCLKAVQRIRIRTDVALMDPDLYWEFEARNLTKTNK